MEATLTLKQFCLTGLPCISKQMQYSKYQSRAWNALLPFALTLPPLISLHPFGFVKPQGYTQFTFAWEPETYPSPQGPSHILLSLRGEGGIPSLLVLMQMTIVDPNAIFRIYQITNSVCLDSCKSKLSIQMQSSKTYKYKFKAFQSLIKNQPLARLFVFVLFLNFT